MKKLRQQQNNYSVFHLITSENLKLKETIEKLNKQIEILIQEKLEYETKLADLESKTKEEKHCVIQKLNFFDDDEYEII